MIKEEFIQQIKNIKVNVPDEYFFLDYNKIVYNILDTNARLQQDKDNLIKYLESTVKELKKAQRILYEHTNTKLVEKATVNSAIRVYQDILERLKSGNY